MYTCVMVKAMGVSFPLRRWVQRDETVRGMSLYFPQLVFTCFFFCVFFKKWINLSEFC